MMWIRIHYSTEILSSMIDVFAGGSYPSGALSNFNHYPFIFFGLKIESMEGFLQGLKFDNITQQNDMFSRWGMDAKRLGSKKKVYNQLLYIQGRPIHRLSEKYIEIVRLAYFTMAKANPPFCKALLDTGNKKLCHSVGKSNKLESILTEDEFCSILSEIREVLRRNV